MSLASQETIQKQRESIKRQRTCALAFLAAAGIAVIAAVAFSSKIIRQGGLNSNLGYQFSLCTKDQPRRVLAVRIGGKNIAAETDQPILWDMLSGSMPDYAAFRDDTRRQLLAINEDYDRLIADVAQLPGLWTDLVGFRGSSKVQPEKDFRRQMERLPALARLIGKRSPGSTELVERVHRIAGQMQAVSAEARMLAYV